MQAPPPPSFPAVEGVASADEEDARSVVRSDTKGTKLPAADGQPGPVSTR